MNASAHRGEILEGPDSRGRYYYFLFWWTDYIPGHPDGEHVRRQRAQAFFGQLPAGIRQWTDSRADKVSVRLDAAPLVAEAPP